MDSHGERVLLLREEAQEYAPSLKQASGWAGNEDMIFAENGLIKLTVSEYCGLWAVCAVPQPGMEALAENWVHKTLEPWRPGETPLVSIGFYSNGEGVFEKLSE